MTLTMTTISDRAGNEVMGQSVKNQNEGEGEREKEKEVSVEKTIGGMMI